MKSPTIFILFLLSAFYTSLLPSATADVVFDTDGNVLENGGKYYVLSPMRPFTGGVRVCATEKERCPVTVVQSRNPLDKGLETIISSPYRVNFIAEGFPLNITFGNFGVIFPCVPLNTNWTVVHGLPEGPAVKIGAPKNAENGWFTIEKELSSYKLVFCQLLENSTCRDIGIHVDDEGNRRLVLTKDNPPLVVQFQRYVSPFAQNNLVLPTSE